MKNVRKYNIVFFGMLLTLITLFFVPMNTYAIKNGEVYDFPYNGTTNTNGTTRKWKVPATGYYQLEVWGAQGGDAGSYRGGYGSYSTGIILLEKDTEIYIVVGGQGSASTSSNGYADGGYNGGGAGLEKEQLSSSRVGGGGGATHIALKDGTLNSFSANNANLLIVAGGGGGAISNGQYSSIANGGEAGGAVAPNPKISTSRTKIRTPAGGSQSSGGLFGYAYNSSYGGMDATCGNGKFGQGGTYCSTSSTDVHIAGGGAGYYGGGASFLTSGAGGSGYINNSKLISYKTITKEMVCYSGCSENASNGTLTNSTTAVNGTATYRNAKTGNGYARITAYSLLNNNPNLSIIKTDVGTFNEPFSPDTKEYNIIVGSEEYSINIEGIPVDATSTVVGNKSYDLKVGNNNIYLTVTAESGDQAIYTLHVTRPPSSYQYLNDIKIGDNSINGFVPTKLIYNLDVDYDVDTLDLKAIYGRPSQTIYMPTDLTLKTGMNVFMIQVIAEDGLNTCTYVINVNRRHSSYLKSLSILGYEIDFDPERLTYSIEVLPATMAVTVNAQAYDDEATIKLNGFGYIKGSSTGTITVTEPNSEPTIYKVTITKMDSATIIGEEYKYNGGTQIFEVPYDGYYRLEAWGAQGGAAASYAGGYGGYATGIVYLEKHQKVYITVGGRGGSSTNSNGYASGGYNGGGVGLEKYSLSSNKVGGGGGATHISFSNNGILTNYSSNQSDLLIVAGGGGGAIANNSYPSYSMGGAGGGYIGGKGTLKSDRGRQRVAAGGTQTGGGLYGYAYSNSYSGINNASGDGKFGQGGTYLSVGSDDVHIAGGGGGFYGGGAGFLTGAGGGSGYIANEKLISYKDITKSMYGYSVTSSTNVSNYTANTNKYSATPTSYYAKSGDGYAKITMMAQPSENNFLSSLTVKTTDYVTKKTEEKKYDPTFDMTEEDYYLTVSSTETTAILSARLEESTAKIDGLGEVEVKTGENIYEIVVTAEAGNTKTYRVHITRPASDNPYPNNITISGLVPSLCSKDNEAYCNLKPQSFDKNTNTYYITVPSRIKQLWFNVDKGHPYQVVNDDGKVSLDGGENEITITVISEKGANDGTNSPSSTYKYVVTRDMTGNTDLEILNILDPEDSNINYDPDILEYYMIVPNAYENYQVNPTNEKDSTVFGYLQMYIEVSDKGTDTVPGASFTVSGPDKLQTGMNNLYIMVTAGNGELQTYILHVYREQSKNTYITDVEIKNGTTIYPLAPSFNKANTGIYNVTVPNDIDNVDIKAVAEVSTTNVIITTNGKACVGIKCNNLLNTGNNTVLITSTAENSGVVEIYKINIFREMNNNAKLSSLNAFNGEDELTLTPSNKPFNPDILDYEVEVPIGTTSIRIDAVATEPTTQVKYLDNNNLKVGENIKRVMTIAEDGTSLTYTIKFIRPADENNYLSNIELSTGTLDPDNDPFDKTVEEYTVEVDNDVTSITITGIKENPLSTIKGNGKYSLVVGENVITLTVTAENGSTRFYNVKVIRKADNNAYLAYITTTEGVIVTTHDRLDYDLLIKENVNKVTLIPVTESKTTTVTPTNFEIETPTSGEYTVTFETLAQDGETTLTYNVKIIKQKSSNAKATSIIMEEGAIKPTFDKNKYNGYTVKVARSVESGTFHVTPEDPRSTYRITGNENFEIGDNTVVVTIIAEDGTEQDYEIVVTRQELTSNYLLGLNVRGLVSNKNYPLNQTFTKTQQYYEVNVPYTETKINVSATLEDEDAEITGTGVYNLTEGDNLIVIDVTSLDGKVRTYQVKVNRKESNDARLESVNIDGSTLSPSFNKDVFEYDLETDSSSINFTSVVPVEEGATFVIIGNKFDNMGEYTVTIRVTAPDGETTQDYIFNVNKVASDNNNLASLSVVGFNIHPEYQKNKTVYSLTVPKDVNNIVVEAIPEHSKATVTGDGAYVLLVGETQIIVEVTSESGKTKSYIILVDRESSDNNLLDNLTVSNGVMTPAFNGGDTYNVIVPYSEESLDLQVTLADDTATYEIVDNKLGVGTYNKVKVVVTAQNGSKKTYTLNVIRQDVISALLKNLKFEDYELTPSFNGNITTYNLTIDNEIDEFIDIKNYTTSDASDISKKSLTVETLDKDATYVISGNTNLQTGNNTLEITVTSSDGVTTEVYTVNINKQTQSNSYLDYLYTSEGDVEPTFNRYVMSYSIDVANDVDKIELYGEAVDKSATVVGVCDPTSSSPCTPYDLNIGENKIEITVTTSSNIIRKYYVTVNRAASDLNYLETLNVKVNGENKTLTPEFDKTHNTYTLDVPVGTEFINLAGTVSENATVTGLGMINLVSGKNEIKINVTSESGKVNTYTLTVNREKSSNNHLIEIIPSIGELDPDFAYEETEYTINLDSSAALLSFEVVTEDTNATVTGIDPQIVPDGTSTRTIIVTAEDGSKRTYTITVNKERTDIATLDSLSVTGYNFEDGEFDGITFTSTFDKDTYEYHITVPNSKKVLLPSEVVATTTDKNAKITKANNLNLDTTKENIYVVTVTAPDGFTKQDYKIYITREKNDEAALTNIKVNIGNLTSVFNPNVFEYEWIVPKGSIITDASVSATASNPNATITKTESVDINGVNPKFEVTVTSEDGKNSVTYILNITLDLSADTTLSGLDIDKGYYEPVFDPDTKTYNVYEYEDETEINVVATPNVETTKVTSGNGLVTLTEDPQTHKIVLTAEDGTTDFYELIIHRTIKKDNGLNNLGLNGLDEVECATDECIVRPVFDPNLKTYNVKVPNEYITLDIYTELMNEQQYVKYKVGNNYIENGTYSLPLGKTEVLIEVYDGMNKKVNTYTLNVDRAKSNNTYLKKLEITEYTLNPKFNKKTQEYTINVDKDVDEVEVIAEPEDPDSRVYINGYNYLQEGNNDVTIEVVAQGGATRTYIVHIVKAPIYNSYLDNITVSTGTFATLTPKFSPTTFEYTTTIDSMYGKATVEAVPMVSSTTIVGEGEYELKTGPNVVTLVATSGDGSSVSIYTVTIIKKANPNVDLTNLIVEEAPLNPSFEKGITKYDLYITSDIDKLTIHPVLEDKNASYIITGNENLHSGDNIVNVIVVSEDKSVSKTYQLTVHKALSNKNKLSKLTVRDSKRFYNLNPQFDPLTNEYTLAVPSTTEKVYIEGELEDDSATVTGLGEEYLNYGMNNKVVTVTSENENEFYYSLNIKREYNLYLKDLLNDYAEDYNGVTFDKETDNYQLTVPLDKDEITFIALAESNKVKVDGTGTYSLEPGDNTFNFVVKAPDNSSKTYTVVVSRTKDDNNYIKSLQVNGMLKPSFDRATETYDVDVRKEIDSLDLDIELEGSKATYEVINNGPFGDIDVKNEVIIRVTAENGSTRDYVLNVYRRPDDYFSNRLLNITIDQGKLNPDFDPDINNYAVSVANSISEVNIETTKENEYATVTGDGKVSLNLGLNVVEILVTSKDGKENKYTLMIYRTENNDATLKSLSVKDYSFQPIFNKLETEYTINIGSEVNKLDITAVPTDPNSKVEILNNNLIPTGNSTIMIKVTAPDNVTSKIYNLNVTKSLSTNNYLSELSVTDYTFDYEFNKLNGGPYTINVENTVNSININAIPEVSTSTVTGDGNVALTTGKNVITIAVTSESGDTKNYTIIANKAANDDATLKDILLSDGTLNEKFDPETLYYEVEVEEEVENITITGIPNVSSSTVTGNGSYKLDTNEKEISLVVKAESGKLNTYKVKVIRKIEASSKLKSLVVKEGELYPGFHKLITSYTILVPNEITSLTLIPTPEDENAKVAIENNSLKVGSNKVKIVVTSADDINSTTYELNVVRQTVSPTYLDTLEVVGYTLKPAFDKTTLYYEVNVPMDVEEVTINATSEDENNNVTGTGTKSINPGDNTFYVKVESKTSGVIRTYQVVVKREQSEENKLLTLTYDVGTIDPNFDPDHNTYTITVPDKTDKITLDGTTSPNSTVSGFGTFDISVGSVDKTISVTSQSGDINVYTITIVRNPSTNTELESLTPSTGTIEYTNDETHYEFDVEDTITFISFEAITKDPDATVEGTDITLLNYGENNIQIIVTAEDGITKRYIDIVVNRKKDITSITVSPTEVLIEKDETVNITYTIDPIDTSYPKVEWISDDDTVATVDSDGNITGVGLGSTTVTVRSTHDNNISATVIVNVINKKLINDNYTINRYENEEEGLNHIIGLEPREIQDDFIHSFDNNPSTVHVFNSAGDEITDPDTFIGTGMVVKLIINDIEYDSLTIVIRGDITGDGIINVQDYNKLDSKLLKREELTEAQLLASDVNSDNIINVQDYNRLDSYLLKKVESLN